MLYAPALASTVSSDATRNAASTARVVSQPFLTRRWGEISYCNKCAPQKKKIENQGIRVATVK